MTNGRSMYMISSYSLLAGHRNSNISFPTVSVDSFLGAARCFLAIESAWGWMLSRRWRAIVIIETLTGLDTPAPGRSSTVPSMRGWRMSAQVRMHTVEDSPKWQRCPDTRPGNSCWDDQSLARMRSSSHTGEDYTETIRRGCMNPLRSAYDRTGK